MSSLLRGLRIWQAVTGGRKPRANTQSTIARPCRDSQDGTRGPYPKSPMGLTLPLPWIPAGAYHTAKHSRHMLSQTMLGSQHTDRNTDLCLLLSHPHLLDTQAQGPATYPHGPQAGQGTATGHRMKQGQVSPSRPTSPACEGLGCSQAGSCGTPEPCRPLSLLSRPPTA